MARRKKTRPAEDLMELVAMLPWWAGVALAPLRYLLLHWLAVQPVVVTPQPGQAAGLVVQAMTEGLAAAVQYILPAFCLFAAAMSAWRRRARK